MREGYTESPLNPLPGVVWLLALPMLVIELILSAGDLSLIGGPTGIGWRGAAIQKFALAPGMLQQMWQTGVWRGDFLMRFVTYPFVHASFTQALFVLVFVLALGKMVAEVLRPWAVLVVFFVAAICGGIVYSLVPAAQLGLIGGYPAVYGMIGAFTYLLWARLGAQKANRYRAFSLIGFLLAAQLVFGLLFGGGWDWVAELSAFVAGFALSFIVGPGGPAHLLRVLRQR